MYPTKYQLPAPFGYRDIARTKFYRSRSLQQVQRSNQVTPRRNLKLVPITDRLGKIEHSLSYAMEEITKISALEENNQMQQKSLKQENKLLKEQIVTQENYSRKKNIKIVGIKSQNNQGLEDSIIRVMRKIGINLSPRDIETAHYITQDRRGENSPVIVRFLHWKDKQSIMTKKDRLRQDNIYIQEDYPRVIEERRRMLIPIFIKALELYPDLQPKLCGQNQSRG